MEPVPPSVREPKQAESLAQFGGKQDGFGLVAGKRYIIIRLQTQATEFPCWFPCKSRCSGLP